MSVNEMKEPVKNEDGEPIYAIGHMCDYEGCRKGGKIFQFGNTLVWICEKHQLHVLSTMFPNIKSQS